MCRSAQSEIDLIDATASIHMLHQTDAEGNTANGGANVPDKHYNHQLGAQAHAQPRKPKRK